MIRKAAFRLEEGFGAGKFRKFPETNVRIQTIGTADKALAFCRKEKG